MMRHDGASLNGWSMGVILLGTVMALSLCLVLPMMPRMRNLPSAMPTLIISANTTSVCTAECMVKRLSIHSIVFLCNFVFLCN